MKIAMLHWNYNEAIDGPRYGSQSGIWNTALRVKLVFGALATVMWIVPLWRGKVCKKFVCVQFISKYRGKMCKIFVSVQFF